MFITLTLSVNSTLSPKILARALADFLLKLRHDSAARNFYLGRCRPDWSTSEFLEKYFLPSLFLAEKLCNHDLMNRLIDLLQDFQAKLIEYFDATFTQLVFEEISSQSKLHLYFAANFACFLASGNSRGCCRATTNCFVDKLGIKPEFLRALFEFQGENGNTLHDYHFNLWDRQCPYSLGRCYFHTHGEGEDCHLK